MTRTLIPTRTAYAAIAAALALSSTPLLAQDAAPSPLIVLPDVAAPPPATITLPEPAVVASPVVQSVPEPEAPAAITPAPRTERATAPVRAVAASRAPVPAERVAAAPPAAPVAQTTFAQTGIPTPPAAPPSAAVPVDPVPAAQPDATVDEDSTGALLAGGAVIALGLLGFAAFRRRKPTGSPGMVPVVERPQVAPAIAGTADRGTDTVAVTSTWDRAPVAAASVPAGSGVVPLPRSMPDTFEERDALLRRMVAARPDRANPFRSPRARHHRAKLILQSLSQSFADREPNIDLSDYPGNWPHLARRRYATAA